MRLPLIGGSYYARSPVASATRCVNLFPELNPRDALSPTTHYQRPGLRHRSSPALPGFGRALYRSSNPSGGQLYAVVGETLYLISRVNLNFIKLGTIATNTSVPCGIGDNGVTLVVVDGSLKGGWTCSLTDLTGTTFALINDSTGAFQGARRVDYMDTFMIFGPSPLNSNQFISTTSQQIQFNSLFIGGKTDYPDPLASIICNRHQLILLGELSTEIWYDAGNAQLPFAEVPGSLVEHGTIAPYSVASSDNSVFWLGQDRQGPGVVFRLRGYSATRISNHALEYAIRQMLKAGGRIDDAVGFTYQQDGHYFYVLNFPTADQTWVFDDSISDPTAAWHQQAWMDSSGVMHRSRVQFAASAWGRNFALDWENGDLLEFDPEYYADDVQGVSYPIKYVRTFPRIGGARSEQGQLIDAEGKQINYDSFMLDIESGTIPSDDSISPSLQPQITCRYSDDRGRTFSGSVRLQLGTQGDYLVWPTFKGNLGRSRDRLWEVEWTGAGASALNGAWVDGKVMHN